MVLIGAVSCGLKLEAMEDDTILTATNVLLLIAGVAAVHLSALWLGLRSSRALGFTEPDSIAVAFAGSQKTLMVGAYVALAVGPLAILPMVVYHAVQLFADTLMRVLARNYASANPDELPLAEEEQGSEDPRIVGSSEILVLDVMGPWASYEYRTDVDITGRPSSHGIRRGVLDLRTGVQASLEALVGRQSAREIIAEGQRQWRQLRDSTLVASRGTKEEFSLRAEYERLSFDPRSFVLEVEFGEPVVRFALAQSGALTPAPVVELGPIRMVEPVWWPMVRADYWSQDETGAREWMRGDFSVLARAVEGATPRASFALRDAGGQEWPLGFVPAAVHRVMWLDDSTVIDGTRAALQRAFDEAALYGEETRLAQRDAARLPLMFRNASLSTRFQ